MASPEMMSSSSGTPAPRYCSRIVGRLRRTASAEPAYLHSTNGLCKASLQQISAFANGHAAAASCRLWSRQDPAQELSSPAQSRRSTAQHSKLAGASVPGHRGNFCMCEPC